MAPRGRPRKYTLGDARMEVAVEHLAQNGLGFDEKVVRKVAAQLLKEYGDGGWVFLEENNYEVLVIEILKYQEMNDDEGSSGAGNKDESMNDDTPTEHALAVSGGSPTATAENVSQDETAEATEGDGQYHLVTNEAAEENEDDTRLMLPSPVSDKAIVIRRRRPCYGWISDDDEDEDDDKPQELYQLTPAGEVDKVLWVTKTGEIQRKRKSMWDLKPEDH